MSPTLTRAMTLTRPRCKLDGKSEGEEEGGRGERKRGGKGQLQLQRRLATLEMMVKEGRRKKQQQFAIYTFYIRLHRAAGLPGFSIDELNSAWYVSYVFSTRFYNRAFGHFMRLIEARTICQ
jgi:hypothetical protein